MSAHAVPKRSLPTLNADGTRRRLEPKLSHGALLSRRRVVGYALIALFVVLPFARRQGKPWFLLDVVHREFTLFGRTFFATDGFFLALLLLVIFVGIVATTALVGRAFCGWACPQTVYLELVFRPIERWFQPRGAAQAGPLRRALKLGVFAVLALALANVFLAYFVGVDTLRLWMATSPMVHPTGALVVAVTAALILFDFGYFREQMCTVICPYARLQSALLDEDSAVIGYDARRGEPRKKGKPGPDRGDCIDCGACVTTCPTGIDIRDGLQLECIACGQCVDACNTIMSKLHLPTGLIRYASQRSLAGGKVRVVRPRLVAYCSVLVLLVGALASQVLARRDAELTVLRGVGAPFELTAEGVRNQLRIKVENHGDRDVVYALSLGFPQGDRTRSAEEIGARVVLPEAALRVAARSRATTTAFVSAPASAFAGGRLGIVVVLGGPDGTEQRAPYTLLGP